MSTFPPAERPDAAAHRPGVHALLHDVAARAARERDPVLAFAAHALIQVHDLYPAADAQSERGTWPSIARTDIHNTITDALVEHLPAITGIEDLPSPDQA